MATEEREELLQAGSAKDTTSSTSFPNPNDVAIHEGSRASSEYADDDDVIRDEEEHERLITNHHGEQGLHRFQHTTWSLKPDNKRKLVSHRGKRSATGALGRRNRHSQPETMYEMEEGDRWGSSESVGSSSEADRERLGSLRRRETVCRDTWKK